ncbi:calcium-binding protein [Rhizobium etli]|uniref:calcium-binding protein n=1 Tax=Rhizobium etli TaxID=29449 RepID=UPI00093F82EB|nr:calcium-binding protein [Rhizobium etli]
MLELSVSSGRYLVFRNNEGGGNSAELGSQIVNYDLPGLADVSFVSSKGTIIQYPVAAALAHELAHAILSHDDVTPPNYTTPGQDYVGETVEFVNAIHAEMGIQDRNSYLGFVFNSDLEQIGKQQGQSLSDGKTVGLVLVNNSNQFTAIDTGDRNDAVVLVGLDLNDTIASGTGNDFLYGGNGKDVVVGREGADILFGNDGDDILVGGTGELAALADGAASGAFGSSASESDGSADYLTGGGGGDTFLVASVLGASRVGRWDPDVSNYVFDSTVRGTFDIIRDYTSLDKILVSLEGADWWGLHNTDFSGFAVESTGYFLGGKEIYSASSGTVGLNAVYDTYYDFNLAQLTRVLIVYEQELYTAIFGVETALSGAIEGGASNDSLQGTSGEDVVLGAGGDDALDGAGGSDHLNGGSGNDAVNGGQGSDTYYYTKSDGDDILTDAAESTATDVLQFTNLNFSELAFFRAGENLLITINGTGETITLDNQYNSAGENYAIEKLSFANGSSLELGHASNTGWFNGSNSADTIVGLSGKDYLIGGLGDDVLGGDAGADVYVYSLGRWQ